jgi:PIN domain nuclease of toxin-antitoxin system
VLTIPIAAWLQQLAVQVRTIPVTPAIAHSAVSLPSSFPGDSADRLIYATATEQGWPLITKDSRLRSHRHPRRVANW